MLLEDSLNELLSPPFAGKKGSRFLRLMAFHGTAVFDRRELRRDSVGPQVNSCRELLCSPRGVEENIWMRCPPHHEEQKETFLRHRHYF